MMDSSDGKIRIAVMGDLHGRLLLAFWLVKKWQEVHDEKIDYILCVGDVGVFRTRMQMDKASRRFADKFPEELGFSKFFWNYDWKGQKFKPHPVAEEVLSGLACQLFFVAGNHEDHDFFREVENTFVHSAQVPYPCDYDWYGLEQNKYGDNDFVGFSKIHKLPEGPLIEFPGITENQSLESKHSITLRAINGLEKYTNKVAWETPITVSTDILLSHETTSGRLTAGDPSGMRTGYGSAELLQFVEHLSPRLHFFGHHHCYYPEHLLLNESDEPTISIGMNQVKFEDNASALPTGCMGILEVSFVPEKSFRWSVVEDEWFASLKKPQVRPYL